MLAVLILRGAASNHYSLFLREVRRSESQKLDLSFTLDVMISMTAMHPQ